MDLIPQLKQEHSQIMHGFLALKDGLKNKSNESHDFASDLQEVQSVLVAHLKLENKLLYPFFTKSKQTELQQLGECFSSEMAEIAKVAMAFFNKYGKENLVILKNREQLRKELVNIIKVVTKRVQVEENILFPAYSKYHQK